MSHKSDPQECHTRVSTRVSCKSVSQECPTRVPHKSVPQDFPTRVSHNSVPQECPTRVSHKSVPQECPTRVSFGHLFLADSDTPPSHERFPDKKGEKLQIGESGGEGRSVATRAVRKSHNEWPFILDLVCLLMWLTNLDVSELNQKKHDTRKHFLNVFAFGFAGSILF